MSVFLKYAFLFYVGSTLGWIMELFFRRFVSSKKWINPGFLTGPYLPIYGFGLCALYFICRIDLSAFIESEVLQVVLVLVLAMIFMTLIELVAGLIFINGMHIKLWDYSNRPLNYKGIICPLFTFIWGILGTIYYFLINPYVLDALNWFSQNLAFSFIVGMFYGFIIIDFASSINLSVKLRKFASEYKTIISYENLKETIKAHMKELKMPSKFIFPFKSPLSLKENVTHYFESIKAKIEKRK